MVPGELPGAKVPPLMIVVAPTVPVPASVPPLLTVMVELAIEPFTISMPALTVQGIAAELVPVSVQVLAPVFWNAPKPWYCALDPICETSKLAFVVPPSASVSAALNAATLPVMIEPARSSSVLVPPVNVMALACAPAPLLAKPPLIVPLLMIVRPEPTMPAPPAPAVPGAPGAKPRAVPPVPPLPPVTAPELMNVAPVVANCAPTPPSPPLPPLLLKPGPPAPPLPPVMLLVLV